MNKIKFVLLLSLLFISVLNINSQVNNKRIKFNKGENSATIKYAVARGETNSYLLRAYKNQKMIVTIMSVEDNAVFTIIDKNTGNFLQGAEDTTDTKRWEGYLPSSGNYKIIVGSMRGGSEYILKVTIE